MSKNFPHDNIYSILGKLEALQPTPQEKHDAQVQEIRESVEAQGSILKGLREVSSTEAKLRQQFAEAGQRQGMLGEPDLVGIPGPAKGTKPSPKAITKGADREYYKAPGLGGTTVTKWRKKTSETLDGATMGGAGVVGEETVDEVTAPGQEDWVKKNKKHFIDQYGKEKGLEVLYATAWKRHHAANESADSVVGEDPMGDTDGGAVWEGEITRKPGVTRHTKLDYPGYPTDDTEDDLEHLKGPGEAPRSKKGRPRKVSTVNPRRDPNAPKKGRGRPAKAPVGGSMGKLPADPFGRVSGKTPSGTPGRVHSMMESVNFKRMMEEQHMTLDEMLEAMNADMQQFKDTGVCSDRLRDMMEVYSHAKRQMEETQGGIGHDLVTPQQRVAQATPPKPGIMGAVKDVAQGASNWLRGKPEQGPTYEDATLDEELNELAKLAGLSIADEGNAFSGKLAQAKAQHKDTFDVDGKEYEVTEADAPVEEPKVDPTNKPKEKYMSMKASTLNPGEGDFGEKQMNPDRPTFKNGDNAMSRPPVRESSFELEAKLAAEYESIKKSK